MKTDKNGITLLIATATIALLALQSGVARGETALATTQNAELEEIVVTANKREQNIQDVGMSIQAATGDQLTKLGVFDTESLQKIVPGFESTPTYFGTTVFTIRGVGFQDNAIAGSPTVSAYIDEAPLPFSILTKGATLDLQRVEVLKGPQGTLFGENATGGAINYIAAKPTDTFHAGGDFSYGNFGDTRLDGYVSGPLSDTLDSRVAFQTHTSSAWQEGYGPQSGQSIGGADFVNGRVSFLWKPDSNFKALLTFNGWRDKSYNQMPQMYGNMQNSPLVPQNPNLVNYPVAPQNDRAAGWNQCVNTSPYDPIAGQQYGAQWLTPSGVLESQGLGSVAQAGGQPTHCTDPRNDNTYYSGTLRTDYEFNNDMTLTSLTEYLDFNRRSGNEASGVPIQLLQYYSTGGISSIYQEFRLAGKWNGKGNWLIGGNFEHDSTTDNALESANGTGLTPVTFSYNSSYYGELFAGSPTSTTLFSSDQPVGTLFVGSFGPITASNIQKTNTYAGYFAADYPIIDQLTLQGGVRFTQENKQGNQCSYDGGDGTFSALSYLFQQAAGSTNPVLPPNGGCATVGPASNNYNPVPGGFASKLDQNNVSWKIGLNYQVAPENLLYFNVSKGYKGGSYPSIPMTVATEAKPAVQEGLLAYEVGFKSTLFDRQLQINGAAFYYDYTNKQILGDILDPVFGGVSALINVPQSHVVGFELSGLYTPHWLPGLMITPAVSYQKSRVDKSNKNGCTAAVVSALEATGQACKPGDFYNYDPFGQTANFTGDSFPGAPAWQASFDAEYDLQRHYGITPFVGAHLQYSSSTNTFFVNHSPLQPVGNNFYGLPVSACQNADCTAYDTSAYNHPDDPFHVAGYALLDLRAGIQKDNWRLEVWGRNVANKYYWTGSYTASDDLIRFAGMPATYGVTFSMNF